MSELEKPRVIRNDDELESLLSHAAPRPTPDDADVAIVRRAVHAEWRKVTDQKKHRQQTVRFALAASVLIVVFAAFSVFRPTTVDAQPVASIQKSFGSVHILSAQSVLTPAQSLKTIHQGQTIVTGGDAGLALAWGNGGSLRLDRNTEVEFRDVDSIYLRSGQIYFDSEPSALIAGIDAAGVTRFRVDTDLGTAAHVGTQFMTSVIKDTLTVSVREGQVVVDGQFHDYTASRGEQVRFAGRQEPTTLSINEFGELWNWTEQSSPSINVDGKSIDEFLGWVSRELGYGLQYADDGVRQHARDNPLRGTVDIAPQAALHIWMETTELEWKINDEGVIYVDISD